MNTSGRTFSAGAWAGLLMMMASLALLAWVISSIGELYDRLAAVSKPVALGALILLTVVLLLILLLGVRFFWTASRAGRKSTAVAAEDPVEAAGQGVEAARQQIELINDEAARRALADRLTRIERDFAARRFSIVVFGTGSAGKTSVINALLGRHSGATDPVVGTTLEGTEHVYTIDGFDEGELRLVDTPGLSEIGEGGMMREQRARELAADADLLLFVVDQDLRDFERDALLALARLGKRSILVFNKRDLYNDEDVFTILTRLRHRVANVIDPRDIVVCAADPAPVLVRSSEHAAPTREKPEEDIGQLADRIAATLRDGNRNLLAGNVLLRAKRVSHEARQVIHQDRVDAARRVVTRFQWTTAGVMFVNPVPGLGALATAAINYQMIAEIARVFGIDISMDHAKRLAKELAQVMIKMGVVGVATDLLGKTLKATVVGYVAGGAIEAVTAAYLTRVSGHAFIEYFAQDQNWGEGGMEAAIERKFDLKGRPEFVREFVRAAAERIFRNGKKHDAPR